MVNEAQIAADLESIRHGRFYFYHHSVGGNVLSGIEKLTSELGAAPLKMVRIDDPSTSGPALVHGGRGRNGQPKTKVDAFAAALRSELRPAPDVALMKFCYVDFNPSTDVDELFSYYRRTLESLKREYPNTRFAHVTVPLMARPTDLKSSMRRLLRLQVWEDAANAKRGEFNRLLMDAFAADPLFDLAAVESAGPGGAPAVFELDGHTVSSLHPAFTEDGGHLNAAGQRAAGLQAVRFLAGAVRDGSRAR